MTGTATPTTGDSDAEVTGRGQGYVASPPPTRTERAVAEVLSLLGAVLVLLVVVRIVS